MYVASVNSPVSNHMVEQESGSSPFQTGQIKLLYSRRYVATVNCPVSNHMVQLQSESSPVQTGQIKLLYSRMYVASVNSPVSNHLVELQSGSSPVQTGHIKLLYSRMYVATVNSPVSNHMVQQESGSSPVQTEQIKLLYSRMYVATVNSPVSNHLVQQESGSSPVQTEHIKRQEFIVWKHKLFSVIHIVLGVALAIVSVIGLRCDIIAEEKHEDCFKYGRALYSSDPSLIDFDIPCLICSFFFIVIGLLSCFMTENRKSNWKCLIHGFQLCSLIGSLVIAPIMAYLGYLGVKKRLNYNKSTTNISVCIVGIFVAEWIFGIAIIIASVCSWFSERESSNQQDTIVVNRTPFQVISTPNSEPAIMTIEETSFQIVQHHTAISGD